MMRKENYLDVIETRVVPTMVTHGTTHYLEDKAPCHTANVCKEFKTVRKSTSKSVKLKVLYPILAEPDPGLGLARQLSRFKSDR